MKSSPSTKVLVWLAAVLLAPAIGAAAESGSGTIEGRVLNASSDTYVKNARVTVANLTLEALTDEDGAYRLAGVPSGEVQIAVFYTGLLPQSAAVKVTAGGTTTRDFSLARTQEATAGDPLKLDAFVVATNREFNAQAIAINEQRYAPNLKNVVSTDEFGAIGEANIGEFIKFIPGIDVNYNGGVFADFVSVRGFPAAATGFTMDGGQPANAGTGAIQRQFDVNGMQVLNSIARVEVFKSPTPDLPASMLGGSVNLVSKSAFERAKPSLSYRMSATTNSIYPTGSFPTYIREKRIGVIRPAADIGYVFPVSKTFGFTLSGSYNERFLVFEDGASTWDLNRLLMTSYTVRSSSQLRKSGSWAATADWKFAENNILSATLNYSASHVVSPRTVFTPAVGANPIGDPTFTRSNGFVGTMTNQASMNADRLDRTWYGALKYRFTGKVWRVDASASTSYSASRGRYVDKGKFLLPTAILPNVAIRLDDINGGGLPGPRSITGATAAGSVDVWDARLFQLRTVTDGRREVNATTDGARIDAARHFDFAVPVQFKTGLAINRESQDNRTPGGTWTFLGPDGIVNNADNVVGNYDFIAEQRSEQAQPYGLPPVKVISSYKIFDHYRANRNQFREEEVTNIQARATNSTKMTETISAAYFRGDVKLLDNRLLLVGGVRMERTQDEGYGPLNSLRATLQQDANGNLVRDSAGRTIPVTTDPVQRALLQFQERGTHAKRSYHGYYPSLNVMYNVAESVVARAAYARTIGRPNYGNIVPGTTVTDPDVDRPTITIRNTALKPWTADAFDLSLEKYFANNGVASVGLFRKDIQDFFGAVRMPATEEALDELGLSGGDYASYEIATTENVGDARISGLEVNYRQALTFLPPWARGVQVFANGTFNKLEGERDADFTGFARRTWNWGISLSRQKFMLKLNWNSKAAAQDGRVAASATIPEDTFNWTPARTTLDGSFEIRLGRRLALFGTARNLTNEPYNTKRFAPTTPEFARNMRYVKPGAFLSLGVRGDF